MLYFFWSFAAFIIALGILITVHELGHFIVARRCNVTVKRFSIGFGHALWRWHDKHGTEYVIAAIPLGGYVKMLDDRLDTVEPKCCHKTFNHKTIWQRAAIVSAGPVFNFLFAIFAYWLVFLIGIPSYRLIISDIIPNSIAAQAEISPGMEIKSADGIETSDWNSVRLQIINKIGNSKITLGVAQFGTEHNEQKILDLRNWQFEPNNQDVIVALGIIPFNPRIEMVVAEIQQGSAAMRAGLQVDDKIIEVNSQPVDSWQILMAKIRNNPGRPLQIDIERQGNLLNITLWPDSKLVGNGQIEGFAGIMPKIIPLPAEYKTVQQYGPFLAMAHASKKNWQLIQLMVSMLSKLITGDIKLNKLSGPIAIAHNAGISAENGLIYYLMFLALISINLGIINLFPLPVLDGGYLLFLAIEKLKGKPVSERVQDFSYRIGLILLVLLMGMAIFNDLSKL